MSSVQKDVKFIIYVSNIKPSHDLLLDQLEGLGLVQLSLKLNEKMKYVACILFSFIRSPNFEEYLTFFLKKKSYHILLLSQEVTTKIYDKKKHLHLHCKL